MKKKAYKNIPNSYFNEKDELVLTLPSGDICGSPMFSNIFVCSKCLKEYFAPGQLRNHSNICTSSFSKMVQLPNSLSITHIVAESKDDEKAIAQRFQKILRYERGSLQIGLGKDTWPMSHAFLLLQNQSLISGLITVKFDDTPLTITDFFTAQSHRRQGFMELLFAKSLELMHESLSSVDFLDLTKIGEVCLERLSAKLQKP